MIIKVDKEGADLLQQMADVALKGGGLANFKPISVLLSSMEIIPNTPVPELTQDDKTPPAPAVPPKPDVDPTKG
jgi:hypothetical protein